MIEHWTSLDKNKEKKREMMLHMTFSWAQTKSHHTTMATLAFTSSFPSSWEHGHQKALQKGG
jgi:hypothetical protein